MRVRQDVAELLHGGLSNAEISRRTGVHPVKVGDARRALQLPDFRDMKEGYIAPPSHRPHGSRTKYVVEKCRCRKCKRGNRREENHRTRMQAYGRWQPFTDAEPVRAHVRALEAYGLGWQRTARLAGVSTGCVSKLLYGDRTRGLGPTKRMRPETAAKILAVKAAEANLGGQAVVDGTGTRRRLQALVAAGWPQKQLAVCLAMEPSNFGLTLRGDRMHAATARAVKRLYDELWRVDPVAVGVRLQAVSAARNKARAEQWAPVGAWDEDSLDDPAAFPDWTGLCGTPDGYAAHRSHRILPACQPCKDAYRAARNARKAAAA